MHIQTTDKVLVSSKFWQISKGKQQGQIVETVWRQQVKCQNRQMQSHWLFTKAK